MCLRGDGNLSRQGRSYMWNVHTILYFVVTVCFHGFNRFVNPYSRGLLHRQYQWSDNKGQANVTTEYSKAGTVNIQCSGVIMSTMASQIIGVSFNRLFRCRSKKKASKLRVTGLCEGNPPVVDSPHKGPVTRKMLLFDGVIMLLGMCWHLACWIGCNSIRLSAHWIPKLRVTL